MDTFWLLVAVLLIFLVGNALLRIIDRTQLYNSVLERLVISYGLGIGTIAILQLYAMVMRIPLNKINILWLLSPFIALEIFYLLKKGVLKNRRLQPKTESSSKARILESASIIYIIFLCLIILFVCLAFPKYAWDSRATWGLKAKMLFTQKTIFNDDFFDPYRFHPSAPYPLLVPLSENFIYNMLGKVDDYSVKIIFAIFYISLVSFFYIAQRKYFSLSKLHSLIFSALFISIPFLFTLYSGSVPSAYADFPLAFFYTLTIHYLFLHLKDRKDKKSLHLATLFATCTLFTKNEGLPLFILSLIIFIMDAVIAKQFISKRTIKDLVRYACLPVIILLPWFIIKAKLPTTNYNTPLPFFNLANIIASFPRLGQVIKLTLREMFVNYTSWGIIWYIIFIAILLNFKRNRHIYPARIEIYLLLIPFVYYLFVLTPVYVFYYTPTGITLEIEFSGTSFERLRLHTLPLLLLFVSLRLRWITE